MNSSPTAGRPPTPFIALRVLLVAALTLAGSPAWAHEETPEILEAFLHGLEDAGDITAAQHAVIDQLYFELGQEEQLHQWLQAQEQAGLISGETAGYISSFLHLEQVEEASLAPAPASYAGDGNVTLLGHVDPQPPNPYYSDNPSTGQLYNGIWGYATGSREYALQTNSGGLHILDVTVPGAAYRVQFIPMAGGRVWRDVDLHEDLPTGKTYAYVGAQSGGDLWVVDLSYLSGGAAHGVDSDPIPPAGYVDRGRTNYGHTVAINDGLLFMNSANQGSTLGCQIFDLTVDPWNPPVIASWSGSQRDCHDSFARVNVPGSGGKDLLYSADGYARSYRILDITAVRSGGSPTLEGQTSTISGIYGHSNWLTDDSHYLYAFDEFNVHDIAVFDVSDPTSPTLVTTFQWSGDQTSNARVHNCQVRGSYLLAGYYEAGFRVFDISNPANAVEVGKYETWRDPDGDGNFDQSIVGNYDGAWNVHAFLPSGNVLVSDMKSGTFIFRVDPVALPGAPTGLVATAGNTTVDLDWTAAAGATGYSVHRSTTGGGPYAPIATHLVGTAFTDTGLTNGTTYYYVTSATNAEGESADSNEASATPADVPVCGDGTCDAGEDCASCAADCPSFPIGGASCGNGLCEAGDGEDCVSCPADCAGQQGGKPSGRFCCGFGGTNPVGCADAACTTGGFDCTETPVGGGGSTCCGDLLCEDPEDGTSCELDCGPPAVCGDQTCDPGEDGCSCASDCGAPPSTEAGLCTDGADNDCDGDTDCADADCDGVDPACPAVDCSTFGDKSSCNAEPSCRWDNKNKVCVPS
jgi:choice-of-anchor B domain-containing protein